MSQMNTKNTKYTSFEEQRTAKCREYIIRGITNIDVFEHEYIELIKMVINDFYATLNYENFCKNMFHAIKHRRVDYNDINYETRLETLYSKLIRIYYERDFHSFGVPAKDSNGHFYTGGGHRDELIIFDATKMNSDCDELLVELTERWKDWLIKENDFEHRKETNLKKKIAELLKESSNYCKKCICDY